MKRFAGLILSVVIAVIVLSGCMKPGVWKSDPETRSVSNEYFDANITPIWVTYGAKSFLLTIINKTDKPIELNWNKTLFISGGQTSGGFMYEGIIFAKRDETKPNDVVFPKGTYQKEIWPNNLVGLDTGTPGTSGTMIKGRYFPGSPGTQGTGWGHRSMKEGVNGIYLTTVVEGKEINEKLDINLTRIQ